MLRTHSPSVRATVGLVLTALLAACSTDRIQSPSGVNGTPGGLASTIDPNAPTGELHVCKQGGPAGYYTFTMSVTGGGNYNAGWGNTVTLYFDGTNPACRSMFAPADFASWVGLTANVTFTEIVPSGMAVDRIEVYHQFANTGASLVQTITGDNAATVTTGTDDIYWVQFFNKYAPVGDKGCTPGYWKQSQHFDSWVGWLPTAKIGTMFSASSNYSLNNYTLLQGLQFKGGPTLAAAAQILLRASIAAELSANTVSYPLSAADIITQVNAALNSYDRETMLGLAARLDSYNNLGCPLS